MHKLIRITQMSFTMNLMISVIFGEFLSGPVKLANVKSMGVAYFILPLTYTGISSRIFVGPALQEITC